MTDLTVFLDDDRGLLPAPPQPPRSWRFASLVATIAAALLVGIGVGYQLPRTGQQPQRSAGVSPAAVWATGDRCSAQTGSGLWLGAQLINAGPGAVTFSTPVVSLPSGGLEMLTGVWGPCGQSGGQLWGPDAVAAPPVIVPEGATQWVSATFALVQPDRCPAPYPVFFRATYKDATDNPRQVLLGFVDLGHVAYSACPRQT
jgi:hypothetical protein